jgi:hypothetical protein
MPTHRRAEKQGFYKHMIDAMQMQRAMARRRQDKRDAALSVLEVMQATCTWGMLPLAPHLDCMFEGCDAVVGLRLHHH